MRLAGPGAEALIVREAIKRVRLIEQMIYARRGMNGGHGTRRNSDELGQLGANYARGTGHVWHRDACLRAVA